MNLNKNQVMAMMSCPINDNFQITSLTSASNGNGVIEAFTASSDTMQTAGYSYIQYPTSPWEFWRDYYYPTIIRESYPVYIKEKAVDKGKQAFEIIKALKDKKLLNVEKVDDFIEAMDTLLKTL